MISVRVFLFVTLTLTVTLTPTDSAQPVHFASPVTFIYKDGDIINVNIFLHYLPPFMPNVARYALYYKTDNCDTGNSTQCEVLTRNEMIPKNKTITHKQSLTKASVTIRIELLYQNNKTCATRIIMRGSRDPYAEENHFHKECISKRSPCLISADFGDKCEDVIERAVAGIRCTQSERLICEVIDEELPEDTVHQWYQVNEDGSYIGPIPSLKGKKTELKMTIQKFDNNTYIYRKIVMKSTNWHQEKAFEKYQVPLPRDGYQDYDIKHRVQYSETEKFEFDCPNDTYTQVAWILPTGNKIVMFKTTSYSTMLTKFDNNSMYCCLSYKIYKIDSNYKTVAERTVDNITLVNVKTVNRENEKDGTSIHRSVPKPTDRDTSPTSPTEQANTDPLSSSNKTNYNTIIIIAAIAGVIILIALLLYVVIKKRCRKSSDPGQTTQVNTSGSANMVLYAELDISPGPTQPPPAEENAYAEIIGVLRPTSEQVKK